MRRILPVFNLSMAWLGLGCLNVGAAILTWNGSTSTAWNNATNWLPPQVPTASDTVIFSAGSLTATTNTAFAIMNWTGGTISGALTVSNGATLYLGGSTLSLYGALTNAGTVVATNTSYLNLLYSPPTDNGAIYNLAGGLFDIRNDQFYLYSSGSAAFFDNAGTLRKSAGSGTTQIYPQLINPAGTVDVETGTISFDGGGAIAGQYQAAAGATIAFANGSYTNNGAAPFGGAGAFAFTGGTLTLLNNLVPNLQLLGGTLLLGPAFQGGSITNLALAGMTLQSPATVAGTLNWTGGTISGGLTVASGATLYLGGSTLNLEGALTNAGTVVATNTSYLNLLYSPPTDNGVIYNLAGGLFDIRNDGFYLYSSGSAAFFDNAGTLRKSAGTGTTQIYAQLINPAGTVDAETGTISFDGGGAIAGQYQAAAGATIAFASGSYTNNSAAQLSGAGAFQFTGGTLTLLNNLVPNLQLLGGTLLLGPAFQGGSITNLVLAGMTLQSPVTVAGTLNWTGGTISGGLTVASGATLYLGGSTLNLEGALTNAGTVVATNTSYLNLLYSPPTDNGVIYNLAGGLLDIRNDGFYLYSSGSAAFFDNAGTLRKSAGTGTTQIYAQLINPAGTVDAQTGTISFEGGGAIAGQYQAAVGATIAFASGSYTNNSAAQLSGAGAFQFTGGTLTLLNNLVPNLQLLGGTLLLGPAFQGGSITNLVLAGMTLQSTNTVTGTMNWTAGTIFGGLTVASGATLYLGGSTLNLEGALTNAGTVVATNTSYLNLLYSPPTDNGAIYNLAGGLFDIRNDQFYLYSSGSAAFFDNAGTLRKSAGTGTTQIYPLVNNANGLIEANSGTIGLQTVPNLAGGEVRFGLSGLNTFGTVSISGAAALTGTVGVALLDGYVPATGNSFTVLTYGSHTGIFASLSLPSTLLWATNYTATTFTVTVTGIGTATGKLEKGQWTANGFLLTLAAPNSSGATTIYATTNLLSAWTPIFTNPPTTNAIEFLDPASTTYRTRFYRSVEQ